MEIKEKIKHLCDICLTEIKNPDRGNTFEFKQGWQSGGHYGTLDYKGHVCRKCSDFKLRRWIANYLTSNLKGESMSKIKWYHFWEPESGAVGGLITGVLLSLILCFIIRFILMVIL